MMMTTDERDTKRNLLSYQLSELGCEPNSAENTAEMLKLIEELKVALVTG